MLQQNPSGAIEILCMQQMMRSFTHGCTKKFFIKLYDIWIFVRFANFLIAVFLINGHLSLLKYFNIAMMVGLSSTTNTSSRTTHNFDGMEFTFARFNFLKQTPCVSQPMCYADIQGKAGKVDGSLTNTIHSPQFIKVDLWQRLFGI